MATNNSQFFHGGKSGGSGSFTIVRNGGNTIPMSDAPVEFDLKFLPDWMKESPATNRYADYQGDTGDRPRRDGGDRRGGGPPRGDRNDRGPRRDGPPRPGGRDDKRGPRRDGPGGPPKGRRDDRGGGDRRGGGRPFEQRRDQERAPAPPVVRTAEVRIEFLPEAKGLEGITRQIKAGNRAYPLFGTARLFLERPERHRVRITSQDAAAPMYQIGDGPISFDRAAIERGAFRAAREEYYSEEVVQGEPLKGNFSNVARCRSSGTLLGPTNYHAYQPGLRKLYEERFSRRMSFPEFQQHEIEILNDEQAIADWKEQARTTTTYVTLKEAEPVTFKSVADAEAHFRKNYLPGLVKTGVSLETSGPASRASNDRVINAALRAAWENEKHFPQNLVNLLRPAFHDAGLHYIKHRKRMVFVSSIRPVRAPKGQVFSEGITTILSAIESAGKCTRHDLAVKILGAQHDAEESGPKKSEMASDLHYLIQAGHVIEFHDGTLDLPVVPGEKPAPEKNTKPAAATESAVAPAQEEATSEEESAPENSAPVHAEALVAVPEVSIPEATAASENPTASAEEARE